MVRLIILMAGLMIFAAIFTGRADPLAC